MSIHIEPQFRVRYAGEDHTVAKDRVMTLCDELVAKHGLTGVAPLVEEIDPGPQPVRSSPILLGPGHSAIAALVADNPDAATLIECETRAESDAMTVREEDLSIVRGPNAPTVYEAVVEPPQRIMSGDIDILGEARSKLMKEQGEASGFSFRETVYRRGMPVIALGEENARRSIEEHEARPFVGDACRDFVEVIRAENRRDVLVTPTGMRMDGLGRLITEAGNVCLTEKAFGVFLTRMGVGGGTYLAKCWPKLRAINVNHWAAKFDEEEKAARELYDRLPLRDRQKLDDPKRDALMLRLRASPLDVPECYGVVSPSYTPFNVDKVAEAIRLAMPSDAKADFSYDGHRTSFDVLFHSNVQPTQYVAGEFFKAGIRVRSSDSGDGSIAVSAIVWQNLCLNLLIIDEANKPLDRISHIGDVHALAARLRAALVAGKASLASFLKAWDYAVDDRLTADTLDVPKGVEVPVRFEDALPGIFNGLYERQLVPLKRPKETIPMLMKAWQSDTSRAAMGGGNTRAAVVNAITRFAHTSPMSAKDQDDLETAAGSLLTLRAPKSHQLAALPYIPITRKSVIEAMA